MASRDYYEALGVSQTADQEEIQKAYRRLAQTCHPDVSHAAGAEERFKEIAEAYEVLGDRDKRKEYDRTAGSRLPSPGRSWRPRDVEEARSSRRAPEPEFFSVRYRDLAGGRGWGAPGPEDITANRWRRCRGHDREATLDVPLRDAIHGGLRSVELERVEYGLDGRRRRVLREKFQVDLPRGLSAGSVIKVPGHGMPGSYGGAEGDLYLRVRILPDERFRVQGHDLLTSIDVTARDAEVGAEVAVATVDGEAVLSLPAGIKNGQRLRIRGQGVPSGEVRGDLLVEVRVVPC